MFFDELLKNSRRSPVVAFHKFLIHYDPRNQSVHAFVEGAPDRAFYRTYLDDFVSAGTLRFYNCEGKAEVYGTYKKVTERFPACQRVLFFVDKDVDDITGQHWPVDPRIYVTDVYAIENYVVCREAVGRFLADFVRVRKLDFDFGPVLERFDEELSRFHRAILPLMAWIVAVRRSGGRPILKDVSVAKFINLADHSVVRKGFCLAYLRRVTGVNAPDTTWRQTRRTCVELKRSNPKRYVRGKFEAWFLLEFVKRLLAELGRLSKQSGGSISVSTSLYESNLVEILVRGVPIPASLESFLNFHFRSGDPPKPARSGRARKIWINVWRRFVRRGSVPPAV